MPIQQIRNILQPQYVFSHGPLKLTWVEVSWDHLPESSYFRGGRDALVAGEEQALEDVGEVTQVEDVVELHGRWHEDLKLRNKF